VLKPVAEIAGGPLGRAAGPQAVGGLGARKVPATGAGEGALDGLDDRAPAALRAFGGTGALTERGESGECRY